MNTESERKSELLPNQFQRTDTAEKDLLSQYYVSYLR